jgi:hypothetical protein
VILATSVSVKERSAPEQDDEETLSESVNARRPGRNDLPGLPRVPIFPSGDHGQIRNNCESIGCPTQTAASV